MISSETLAQTEGDYEAHINSLCSIIYEQRETIVSLNSCIGGEGSTTTDNLVRVSRLESIITKQQAMIAELEKDAARYRWLREYMASTRTDLDDFIVEACCNNNPSDIDEAIDKAMQGEAK